MKKILFLPLVILCCSMMYPPTLKLALLKYSGGGDWYSDPTALTNLAKYCNEHLNTNLDEEYATVDVSSLDIFNYPFVHMTGHGNVVFSDSEAENLRDYLLAGGFLHIDDNYGIDPYVRVAMKKVFPEYDFIELPFNHDIYNVAYKMRDGLPKVHEHDGKPSQGFGIIHEGRLLVFYTYECDLGDGWEDKSVHNVPDDLRKESLMMGANIVEFAFSN